MLGATGFCCTTSLLTLFNACRLCRISPFPIPLLPIPLPHLCFLFCSPAGGLQAAARQAAPALHKPREAEIDIKVTMPNLKVLTITVPAKAATIGHVQAVSIRGVCPLSFFPTDIRARRSSKYQSFLLQPTPPPTQPAAGTLHGCNLSSPLLLGLAARCGCSPRMCIHRNGGCFTLGSPLLLSHLPCATTITTITIITAATATMPSSRTITPPPQNNTKNKT